MHVAMVIGTIAWFVLVGLLWSARPGEVLWLIGSVLLGTAFAVFGWYVTLRR